MFCTIDCLATLASDIHPFWPVHTVISFPDELPSNQDSVFIHTLILGVRNAEIEFHKQIAMMSRHPHLSIKRVQWIVLVDHTPLELDALADEFSRVVHTDMRNRTSIVIGVNDIGIMGISFIKLMIWSPAVPLLLVRWMFLA